MIIVKLSGGLANQMFQYAAGRSLSYKNNDELKLDLSFYNRKNRNVTKRNYELSVFNIIENIANEREIKKLIGKKTLTKKLLNKLGLKPFSEYIKEKGFNFDQSILELKGDIYLDGYFQSEKYFKDIEGIIKKDFTLKQEYLDKINKDELEKIKNINSISIHVRRGDYANDPKTNEMHGTCSIEYYNKAVELIAKKTNNPEIFIFSDDIEWCKESLKFNIPTTYITGNKSHEDLYLMGQCKHNIIANSSFSWWAAWLNENKNKFVIAPSKWFNKNNIDTSDLIPKDWLKI